MNGFIGSVFPRRLCGRCDWLLFSIGSPHLEISVVFMLHIRLCSPIGSLAATGRLLYRSSANVQERDLLSDTMLVSANPGVKNPLPIRWCCRGRFTSTRSSAASHHEGDMERIKYWLSCWRMGYK